MTNTNMAGKYGYPALERGAINLDLDNLDMPALHGFARWQAYLVDRIKRAAIRRLHRSHNGECWMLRLYLAGGGEATAILSDKWTSQIPSWMTKRLKRHQADEQRHVALFDNALRERGIKMADRRKTNWLGYKTAQWQRLTQRYAPRFTYGVLVTAYATCLCAKQMAMRLFARHCETIGETHPLYALLARVQADETRHVKLCMNTLRYLVVPAEAATLTALLADIRTIEAQLGITGALALYAAGWFYSLVPGTPRQSITP